MTSIVKNINFNPDIIIEHIKFNKDITYHVIRDDMLLAGTKQRGFTYFTDTSVKKYNEFLYTSPYTGYAQIVLALCGAYYKKKITIFIEKKTPRHPFTNFALELNPKLNLIEISKPNLPFKEIRIEADNYYEINNTKNNIKHFKLGFDDKTFKKHLKKNIKKAWPKGIHPKRIWIVAGSGFIFTILAELFPNTFFNIIQTGKTIWPDQLPTNSKLYIAPQKFYAKTDILPPYPSVATYDAKLWQFVLKHGKDNDYIWNVAKDLNTDIEENSPPKSLLQMNKDLSYTGGEIQIKNIKDFIKLFSSKDIKFPYKKIYYDKEKIHQMFDNLKLWNHEDNIVSRPYRINNIKIDPLYKKNYRLIINKNENHEKFNILSDMFNEECRVKCKIFSQKYSPYEYLNKNYEQLGIYCLEKYNVITHHTLRESIYEQVKECTSFKPTNLLAVIQMFKPESILDFSAGWGDRLIGFIASDAKSYCGIDPNDCVHIGYKAIVKFFKKEIVATGKKIKLINDKFEDINLKKSKYDMVFTSPPYFDLEDYTDDNIVNSKKQSSYNYKTQKSWFHNFLKVAINKSCEHLNKDGHLILVINQKKGERYIYDMLKYTENLHIQFLGVIGYANENVKNPQPMFIWRKI
jgi:tRNA1(Val) A37 N6-methylase TrmN6